MVGKADSIKTVLNDVISEWKRKGQSGWEDILINWPDIVGRKAALHTRPASLKDGCLTVNVDTSPWLYEMTLKKRAILEGLLQRFDMEIIREIRLKRGDV